MSKMPFSGITFLLLLLLSALFLSSAADYHRHLLHQPFFPVITAVPPTQPPSSSAEPPSHSALEHTHKHHRQELPPPPQEKHTFSSVTSPNVAPPQRNPFFPSSDPATAAPPPPPSPPASLPTFPANISSLLFPSHSSSDPKPQHGRHVAKLIAVAASVVSAALLLCLLAVFFLFLRQRWHRRRAAPADDAKSSRSTDSLRLFNTAPSDGSLKHKQPPKYTSTNTSSEFLYLGTLVNSRSGGLDQQKVAVSGNVPGVVGVTCPASASSSSQYQKMGSPELRPLPPLPKYSAYTPTYQSSEQLNPKVDEDGDDNDNDNDEFYSPKGSSGRKQSPARVWSSSRRDFQGFGADHFGSTSFNSRTASYPYSNTCSPTDSMSSSSASPTTNTSPTSLKLKSPDSIMNFPAHTQPQNPSISSVPSSSSGFGGTQSSLLRQNTQNDGVPEQSGSAKPPPPPPPPQFLEIPACSRITPARDMNAGPTMSVSALVPPVELEENKNEDSETKEDSFKPKLKPLHWDKVRASSNRVMVWDQIKSSSFQLNEEMIETLFRANDPGSRTKDAGVRQSQQSSNQENQLIDPKKAQNIAILLRALNVTIDEVCEAISEGNSDTLGPELLECLLKMAPTREEEDRLKELKDDESSSKLGPAEKFLKALLDIPFAFKRIDAMLYIVNFESETEYLTRSFETLEAACGELKNTRMFLKLLEAVLKTGNRMNIGTNRGDAHAFKLDTLLKLVDIKGTDGKTTLLHFVVQEIIKSEGARISTPNQNHKTENITEQSALQDDLELRKLGLQVVSGLSSQMTNVKKAAALESATLSNDVTNIAAGITKVKEVAELKQEIGVNPSGDRFLTSMNLFLNKAENGIAEIKTRGSNALKTVKEVTEYFHGNSEAQPFRIFAVVRDFLAILDQVCKEVGRINERTVYGSVRPSPTNPSLPQLFPALNARQNHPGSSDDESTQ